jgi:hypothetical protein
MFDNGGDDVRWVRAAEFLIAIVEDRHVPDA